MPLRVGRPPAGICLPPVRGRAVRIKRERLSELRLGSSPVPLKIEPDEPQRGVRLGQRRVQLESPPGVAIGCRECLGWGEVAQVAEDRVGIRKARIGCGKLRIDRDGGLEPFDGSS